MALTVRLPKGRATKAGRPRGKFTQFRRLDALRTLLEEHPVGVTLAELASTLRVSERSVRRYVREMKDALQLEWVEPVPGGARVWRVKPGERGRAVVLRRAQAQALLATRKLFEMTKGSAFYDEVELAFGELHKLAQRPSGRTSGKSPEPAPDTTLPERFAFLAPPSRIPTARAEEVDMVLQAISGSRALSMKLRSSGGEVQAVTLYPYGLVFHQASLVLVGWLEHLKNVAVVRFEDTSSVEQTDRTFRVPEAFDLAEYLHGELGVAVPSKARLLVEFDAKAADLVRSRKVHPAQRVAQAPDGRVRVSAPLGDRASARAWVLGFGDLAKVLEPEDLADELRETFRRAAARYDRRA